MELGSTGHKATFYRHLIKTYHENIWTDEIQLILLEEAKGEKQKEITEIDLRVERKEFKTKNEASKTKFIAERELEHIDKEIKQAQERKEVWAARIALLEEKAKEEGFSISE